MKVRLISKDPNGFFIISKEVEYEALADLAGEIKSNAAAALAKGLIDIIPAEAAYLGRLFPDGEPGILVTMFLDQQTLQERRGGIAGLFQRPRRPKKPKPRRR
jgi:hypothetical protein